MPNLQIKVNEPDIIPDNPWDGDKLNRRACAETLTRLLEGQTAALTISLNGEWGSGKTYLLRRWRQQLKNEDYAAIYFNAWEDDFLSDPLVAIIGQLWKELKQSTYKEICESVKVAAVPFLKKVGIGLLNHGIEKITGTNIAEIAEEELKTASESAFDDYAELTAKREDLKARLKALADKVYEDSGKPLVFIIDELDRCRPTFAIEVLERVKHLFHIDHMIFVLGIDRKQLGNSIQAVYGNIEVENYLHRFIDLDFVIPAANPEKFFEVLWERYEIRQHLTDKSNVSPPARFDIEEAGTFRKIGCTLCQWHRFSLREIEQLLKIYSLLLRSTKPHCNSWPCLAPILILLKLKNPELYQKYLLNTCSVTDIVNYVMAPAINTNNWIYHIIPATIYHTFLWDYSHQESRDQILAIKKAIIAKETIDGMPLVAECLKNRNPEEIYNSWSGIGTWQRDYCPEALQILAKKIDLLMTGVEERQ